MNKRKFCVISVGKLDLPWTMMLLSVVFTEISLGSKCETSTITLNLRPWNANEFTTTETFSNNLTLNYLKWFVVFLDAGDQFSEFSIHPTHISPHRPRGNVESIEERINCTERLEWSERWGERIEWIHHRIEVGVR